MRHGKQVQNKQTKKLKRMNMKVQGSNYLKPNITTNVQTIAVLKPVLNWANVSSRT